MKNILKSQKILFTIILTFIMVALSIGNAIALTLQGATNNGNITTHTIKERCYYKNV